MNGNTVEAYSHLAAILSSRNIAIPELRRQMKRLGVPVNIKSLYRLISAEPVQKIDLRIVGAICQTCHVGIQDVIDFSRPKPSFQRLETQAQKRLDELMSKNNEGTLTASERKEFNALAERAHQLTMANARLLAAQRRNHKTAAKRIRRPKPDRGAKNSVTNSDLRHAA